MPFCCNYKELSVVASIFAATSIFLVAIHEFNTHNIVHTSMFVN